MAAFEILVNGERRFLGEYVTAITLAADWVARREADRVFLHVGVGHPDERQVQFLGADLLPGDEILVRVLTDEESWAASDQSPKLCSFCGNDFHTVGSLVGGPQLAICGSCVAIFHNVVSDGAALPVGASIREQGDAHCGFGQKSPPEVAGLLMRNAAAICPECLRACADIGEQD